MEICKTKNQVETHPKLNFKNKRKDFNFESSFMVVGFTHLPREICQCLIIVCEGETCRLKVTNLPGNMLCKTCSLFFSSCPLEAFNAPSLFLFPLDVLLALVHSLATNHSNPSDFIAVACVLV